MLGLVPVVLLTPVEVGDLGHLLIGQGEVEDGDVLLDVVGFAGVGDGDHAALESQASICTWS